MEANIETTFNLTSDAINPSEILKTLPVVSVVNWKTEKHDDDHWFPVLDLLDGNAMSIMEWIDYF